MASLQEALRCLAPITWDSIPTDPDKLRSYIDDISTKARLIVDSVPEPAPSDNQTRYAFESSSPAGSRLAPSPARTSSTEEIASLQRQWGKPIKVSGTKENPLEIPIYKVQGSDGKGHWFGRRSVHAGLPFAQWREKLAGEMDETLRANQARMRRGRAADQAVRGIGAERLIERLDVKDGQGEGILGSVNLYHVSAQFPKPTTPRDFVTLIIHWETQVNGNGSGSGDNGVEARRRGRNWMMVSKPCVHPDAPPRQGYIRGQYESVEFIREIPVDKPPGDVPRGKAVSPVRSEDGQLRSGVSAEQDEDPYPIEWIMVTRSDPGGNIPRWMVEKGTPRSICTDAAKFLDWACRECEAPRKGERDGKRQVSSETLQDRSSADDQADGSTDAESDYTEYQEEEHHGLIASFTYLLNAGLERYAPQAVLDYLPQTRQSPQYSSSEETDAPGGKAPPSNVGAANGKGGIESLGADPLHPPTDAASQISQPASLPNSVSSTPLEIADTTPPAEAMKISKKGKLSSHEKQLAKLAQRKGEIEAQLENVRNEIQTLRLESPNQIETKKARAAAAAAAAAVAGDSYTSDQASVASIDQKVTGGPAPTDRHKNKNKTNLEPAHMHKIASGLFQQESKLLKQLGKIEKHQLKETSKIDTRQRKHADREEKSRTRAEADALRLEVETLKREVERLRTERRKWIDLVASLQAENTRLAAQVQEG